MPTNFFPHLNRIIQAVIIIVIVGCKDANWGQSFKDFAGSQAGPLSHQYAAADLSLRWERLYRDGLPMIKMETDISKVALATINIKHEPIAQLGMADIRQEKIQLSADFLKLLTLIQQNDLTQKYLQNVNSLCHDKNAFSAFGLNNHVIHQAMQHMVPSINESTLYSINNNPIETVVNLGSALFSKRKFEKQQKLFDEGMILLDQQLIKDHEIFTLSSNICQQTKVPYQEIYHQFQTLLQQQRSEINLLFEAISLRTELVDSALIVNDINDLLDTLGLRPLMRDLEQSLEEHELSNILDQVFAQLQELKAINTSPPISLATQMKLEESLDSIHGFIIQLELLLPNISNAILKKRVEQQLHFLKNAAKSLAHFYPGGKR